jgi:hypothetical protein
MNFPIIHINGNSAQTLLEQYAEAFTSLSKALNDFAAIDFHGRDYYVGGDEYYDKALAERNEALVNIRAALSYVDKHTVYLADSVR